MNNGSTDMSLRTILDLSRVRTLRTTWFLHHFYSFLSNLLILYRVGISSECNGLKKEAYCLGKRETT